MRCCNLLFLAITVLVAAYSGCDRKASTQTDANQAAQRQETFGDAQSAATASLAVFRKLVNNQNYRDLGFESVEEAASATLGTPIPVVFVRLDQLREYREGTDLNSILSQSNQMNFPVMVRDQVRSSVVVDQADGKWKIGTLGNGALAKQLAALRPGQPAPGGSTQQALVHFGALAIYFLGERTDNKWMLKSLSDNPDLNLGAGKAVPAEEVFTRVAPIAKALHDDAPM